MTEPYSSRVAFVVWVDSTYNVDARLEIRDLPKITTFHSAGVLVSEDDKAILLVQDSAPDDPHYRRAIVIPRIAIVDFQTFEPLKPLKPEAT